MNKHKEEELLKVVLIDFTISNNSTDLLHHSDDQYLISLLKKKINTPKFVPFPLFNYSSIVNEYDLSLDYSYSVSILYKYSVIIISKGNCLVLLDIDTRKVKSTIELDLPTITCFYIEECPDDGTDYIYFTSYYLFKYDLKKLIEGRSINECFVWKSVRYLISPWEVATFQSDVYVCDYGEGLLRFNKNDGSFISVRSGKNFFGLTFTPEYEMLLTHDACLEVLIMNNGEWVVAEHITYTPNDTNFKNLFSIYYESKSRYIYVSSIATGKIIVFERDPLKVITTITGLNNNYGIAIDNRNGFLYVCSENGEVLQCIR